MTPAQGFHPASVGPAVLGIEILRTPMPRAPFLPDGCGVCASVDADSLPSAPSFADPDDIATYRWWLGHQATFCVWRLLSTSLALLAEGERSPEETVAAATHAAQMYDVYSVLLLYAGSCSPEVYSRVIRSEMARADPAFSGRWARDYEDIPRLFRAVRQAQPAAFLSDLRMAYKANLVVHAAMGGGRPRGTADRVAAARRRGGRP
jgi:hypothetical protein